MRIASPFSCLRIRTALGALLAGCCLMAGCLQGFFAAPVFAAEMQPPPATSRPPRDEADLRYWLKNMVVDHGFTDDEVSAATGLSVDQVSAATKRFHLKRGAARPIKRGDPLRILPYPGGHHPRIGFLEGAVNPQRETKVSVFTPWDPASYVVVDVPEAIFSNLGLTYLAHTHVPTIWTVQGIELPALEWKREPKGVLRMERALPNGVVFGTKVTPRPDGVLFDQWLINGTTNKLTGLRVQDCVMLKMAAGFNQQTNANKILSKPYAAVRSENGQRWIITAFEPCDRVWQNPPVPCIHSDPKFPDCPPGQTTRIRGWLSFYEGTDIEREFKRLEQSGWKSRDTGR